MHLNLQQLHAPEWAQKGYDLPKFDVERVRAAAPRWVHFGAGNIFRSFIACAQQTVLDKGLCDHGIVVCEGFDPEIVERAYRPFDNLSVAVSLKANGGIDKRLVASVVESLTFADMARLQEIFASGTAAVISPIGWLNVMGTDVQVADGTVGPVAQKLYDTLYGMQTGTVADDMGWTYRLL